MNHEVPGPQFSGLHGPPIGKIIPRPKVCMGFHKVPVAKVFRMDVDVDRDE